MGREHPQKVTRMAKMHAYCHSDHFKVWLALVHWNLELYTSVYMSVK